MKSFARRDSSRAWSRREQGALATCGGRPRRAASTTVVILLFLSIATVAWAQKPPKDLTSLSLEDLMNVAVTSGSKKEEKLFRSATAIYVITAEEIRRSAMTSIPELLRMVPGLDVARINGNIWAISARGFNGRFGNKLLVMIDGRSVYSATFAGVYWNVQDLPLEDVERIEVIRGPGTTLWGSNAVNGVISIITKHPKETQGGLVTAGGGTEDRAFGTARYGGKIGDKNYYRIYARYFDRNGLADAQGRNAGDDWSMLRGGGRMDLELSGRDRLTVQGDIYHSNTNEMDTAVSPAAPFAPLVVSVNRFAGGNILGLWRHEFSSRSDMELRFYYDRARRRAAVVGEESSNTYDFDFQHHFALGGRQDIVWGLGYRFISSNSKSDSATPVRFTPKGLHAPVSSAFVQDEVTLIENRLQLTLATKFEDTIYGGIETQPSVRLLWTPRDNQTFWGAISRAARTTLHDDRGVRANVAAFPVEDGTTAILAFVGNPNTRPERLVAYELGYRIAPTSKISFDLATFYNSYDRLNTEEPDRPFFETDPLPPHLVIPFRRDNLMRGVTYGLEASASWNATTGWKMSGAYSLLRMQLSPYATSRDTMAKGAEGDSPRHQIQFHSLLSLPSNFEADAALYYVSRLANQQTPDYTRVDARLGWRPTESFELSVGGQNLLDGRHAEFAGLGTVLTSDPRRSVYGKLTWRF